MRSRSRVHAGWVAGCLTVAVAAAVPVTLSPVRASAETPPARHTSVQTYDDFTAPGGYSLADYQAKWSNIYGLGEMAVHDTRSFTDGSFTVSATPFQTSSDYSVYDHLKYFAVSTRDFPVPTDGSVEFSGTIKVATPGTQPGRVVHGTYLQTGAPYAATTLEGQQAAAVLNMIDFHTGQLFDWFVSGHTAFPLYERLPSTVTGNTTDTTSADYVGRDTMYTQIVKEIPSSPGTHQVAIRFTRAAGSGSVDYFFDGALVAHLDHVGIPLDKQGRPFTGTYPSLGPGEELGAKINSVTIGHGLFSLLDAFPFQHPQAPEAAVTIPIDQRLFGQGAKATFDDFRVKTTTG